MANAYRELINELDEIGKTFNDIDYLRLRFGDFKHSNKYKDFKKRFLMTENNETNINNLIQRTKEIDYDWGYGCQELFGEIVFKDGTRLERFEYDGLEYRDYKEKPQPKDESYFTTKHY